MADPAWKSRWSLLGVGLRLTWQEEGVEWQKVAKLMSFGDRAFCQSASRMSPRINGQWSKGNSPEVPNHGIAPAPPRRLIHGTAAMLSPVFLPLPCCCRRALFILTDGWSDNCCLKRLYL